MTTGHYLTEAVKHRIREPIITGAEAGLGLIGIYSFVGLSSIHPIIGAIGCACSFGALTVVETYRMTNHQVAHTQELIEKIKNQQPYITIDKIDKKQRTKEVNDLIEKIHLDGQEIREKIRRSGQETIEKIRSC